MTSDDTLTPNCLREYTEAFQELDDLCEGNIPVDIRRFDIRFRLSCGLQIGFDTEISRTKTESVKKTYKALMELNDLWFVYEGLYMLCRDRGVAKQSGSKHDPFVAEMIQEIGLQNNTQKLSLCFRAALLDEAIRRQDLFEYLEYLRNNTTGSTQIKNLGKLSELVQGNQGPSFGLWLSLIYSMRNLYVHSADTAKAGVKRYTTKIIILKISKDFLVQSMTLVAIALIRAEAARHE